MFHVKHWPAHGEAFPLADRAAGFAQPGPDSPSGGEPKHARARNRRCCESQGFSNRRVPRAGGGMVSAR